MKHVLTLVALPLLALACTGETTDTGPEAPHTSDTVVEIQGTPMNECTDKLHLQIGFLDQVPSVTAELRIDADGEGELHTVPYGGLDKDTETIHLYDIELTTGADEADGNHTTFTCDDYPVAGYRVYDEEGGLMACYFGEFVLDWFDATGCPE